MAERKIYLVRHGVAEGWSSSGDDFQRALTDTGVAKMQAASRGLVRIGVEPDWILTSPYVRARETADILATHLRHGARDTWEELGCGVDEEAVVARIEALDPDADVMLVGHEPDMSELLSFFLSGRRNTVPSHFRKGAVACLSAGALPPMGCARLEWFERAVVLGQAGE